MENKKKLSKKEKEKLKAVYKYRANWVKESKRRFEIRVDVKKEQDIISWLESKENVNNYIKELLREDMEK